MDYSVKEVSARKKKLEEAVMEEVIAFEDKYGVEIGDLSMYQEYDHKAGTSSNIRIEIGIEI